MNRVSDGVARGGYTIVETLIFLAVSGLLLIGAMLAVGGQQRKSMFTTGIHDVESQLIDLMNDVATGYYNNPGGFTCTAAVSAVVPPPVPVVTPGAAEQGTNSECTFVGKVLQFAPTETGPETAGLYTLIGRRRVGLPPADVRTLAEAAPVTLPTSVNANATITLPGGIRIRRITYGAGPTTIGSIAFVSRYGAITGSGGITGTQDIDLIPINSSVLAQDTPNGKATIDAELLNSHTASRNPNTGISLCFDSGSTNQSAIILIGGSGRQNSTQLTINNGLCP